MSQSPAYRRRTRRSAEQKAPRGASCGRPAAELLAHLAGKQGKLRRKRVQKAGFSDAGVARKCTGSSGKPLGKLREPFAGDGARPQHGDA